jgi:hypothetical protein
MPSAFSTTTWPTTMAGPIAACGCSRPTALDTSPLLGRQREPESLESRSSAVCIIATPCGRSTRLTVAGTASRLSLGWSFCTPQIGEGNLPGLPDWF